ncbi:MAG TPA: peptide-methionine (S)-S-oxide reductase MsrA [Candidatus Thermoplasmatota archaeon]|jgi:peptide-methionine (S)-S-oxide reductase|nr:peptide-methionine (S)-S-oxide reductase MsrA [Candidatus Thermoplasmatota archaeon]
MPATEIATLGGGCFWCLEAAFEQLGGVQRVVSGYAGGSVKEPSYEAVCSGATGHAEVTQVAFDPSVLGFRDLLQVFFTIHDPTTMNRQGADVGTQYRSIVLWHSPEQRAQAEQLIKELEGDRVFDRPIVTEVKPFTDFYPAEAHHQGYYRRNPQQAYCRAVISPKLAKLRAAWASRLK